MSEVYQIPDEPKAGRWENLATQPLWPLLAGMLGGPIFGWAWLILNALAFGSPTIKKEVALVLSGWVGLIGFTLLTFYSVHVGLLPKEAIPYMRIANSVIFLSVSYLIFLMQNRSFGIYEYYGGHVASGWIGLFIGFFIGPELERIQAEQLVIPLIEALL
jgi:hypothetical protein